MQSRASGSGSPVGPGISASRGCGCAALASTLPRAGLASACLCSGLSVCCQQRAGVCDAEGAVPLQAGLWPQPQRRIWLAQSSLLGGRGWEPWLSQLPGAWERPAAFLGLGGGGSWHLSPPLSPTVRTAPPSTPQGGLTSGISSFVLCAPPSQVPVSVPWAPHAWLYVQPAGGQCTCSLSSALTRSPALGATLAFSSLVPTPHPALPRAIWVSRRWAPPGCLDRQPPHPGSVHSLCDGHLCPSGRPGAHTGSVFPQGTGPRRGGQSRARGSVGSRVVPLLGS